MKLLKIQEMMFKYSFLVTAKGMVIYLIIFWAIAQEYFRDIVFCSTSQIFISTSLPKFSVDSAGFFVPMHRPRRFFVLSI